MMRLAFDGNFHGKKKMFHFHVANKPRQTAFRCTEAGAVRVPVRRIHASNKSTVRGITGPWWRQKKILATFIDLNR